MQLGHAATSHKIKLVYVRVWVGVSERAMPRRPKLSSVTLYIKQAMKSLEHVKEATLSPSSLSKGGVFLYTRCNLLRRTPTHLARIYSGSILPLCPHHARAARPAFVHLKRRRVRPAPPRPARGVGPAGPVPTRRVLQG